MNDATNSEDTQAYGPLSMFPNGDETIMQAFGAPLQQTMLLQRNAVQFFINSLEMQTLAQQRGLEFTRQTVNSYLQSLNAMLQSGGALYSNDLGRRQQSVQRPVPQQQVFTGAVPQQLYPQRNVSSHQPIQQPYTQHQAQQQQQ
jgi:hypothetical protein